MLRRPDPDELRAQFARLHKCLAKQNADCVQDAINDLGCLENGWKLVPDEIVKQLLTLLESEHMYESHLTGHVLNFFEFESRRLSADQKTLCTAFLNAHGDKFTDVHSPQVVSELRHDDYLR